MLRARQRERSEAPRSVRCWRDEEKDAEAADAESADDADEDAAAGGEDVSWLVDRLRDAMQSGVDAASG